jgi:predicted membrane GTPase involved in stress response
LSPPGPNVAAGGHLGNAITGHHATAAFLSREAQHATILRLLAARPYTSYELRRAGCYQCPTRILELRRAGYTIETTRVTVVDRDGFEHPRVALYSLREAQEGAVR